MKSANTQTSSGISFGFPFVRPASK